MAHTIGKMLNPDEGGPNAQYLSSTQRETIQSRQSVAKLNKDIYSMVAQQNPSLRSSFRPHVAEPDQA
jgi:hypothetical protein